MAGRRKGRRLSEAERALWSQVADTVTRRVDPAPLVGATADLGAPSPAPARPAAAKAALAKPATKASRSLRLTDAARPGISLPLPGADRPAPVPRVAPGLDRATARKLGKGLKRPEARLDLHGMTQDRAHAALTFFLHDCAARGRRCVLVITGKGPGDPGEGVLRRAVPRWMEAPALRPLVLGVYEAHQRHGGAGALYVYLRRRR